MPEKSDDIDITGQQKVNPEPTPAPEPENNTGKDSKAIFITIAVLAAIFAAFFFGFKFFGTTGATVVTLDDLHDQNLEGNLEDTEGYMYNGFSFVKTDGLWWTDIVAGDTFIRTPLHFGPREVEHIPLEGNLDDGFNEGQEVYLAIDPYVVDGHYTLAFSELTFNLAKGINRAPVGACIREDEQCVDRPIVSCEDTKGHPVIEFALEQEPSVVMDGTCIKISGMGEDLVKAADRILYHWYQIIR